MPVSGAGPSHINFMEKYKQYFLPEKLKEVWEEIRYKTAPGADRINRKNFDKNLDMNISNISNSIITGKFRFSPYNLKLVSKGSRKFPREISIPVIKDKIVLKSMNELLKEEFQEMARLDVSPSIISKLKKALKEGAYNSFIRLDIKDFYPSIRHKLLLKLIKDKLKGTRINALYRDAIKQQPGLTRKQLQDSRKSIKGVPQGLSISNTLANIYMSDIDQDYQKKCHCLFFRYVDDMLILCSDSQINEIETELVSLLKKKGLRISKEKREAGLLAKGFIYLGYSYEANNFSVKVTSFEKIRNSIAKIFTEYRYRKELLKSNPEKWLERKLNWRITGFIRNKKRYGWLFFFSQIDDKGLLHELDNLVSKYLKDKRFNVQEKLNIKSFVQTYFYINHQLSRKQRLGEQGYVPNLDIVSHEEKKQILIDLGCHKDEVNAWSEEDVKLRFDRLMRKEERMLEEDVIRAS